MTKDVGRSAIAAPADEIVTVMLDAKQKRGAKRPVIHVLTASGRMDEFKDRGVVIPEGSPDPADGVVRALLINGNNEPFYTADGQLAIVDIPVVGFNGAVPDPDRWLNWKEMAKRAGMTLSTAKRRVKEGLFPEPVKLGARRVGFKQGEVDAAIARLGNKR